MAVMSTVVTRRHRLSVHSSPAVWSAPGRSVTVESPPSDDGLEGVVKRSEMGVQHQRSPQVVRGRGPNDGSGVLQSRRDDHRSSLLLAGITRPPGRRVSTLNEAPAEGRDQEMWRAEADIGTCWYQAVGPHQPASRAPRPCGPHVVPSPTLRRMCPGQRPFPG